MKHKGLLVSDKLSNIVRIVANTDRIPRSFDPCYSQIQIPLQERPFEINFILQECDLHIKRKYTSLAILHANVLTR